MNQWLMGIGAALGLTAALAPALALAAEPAGDRDPRVGRSYRVPYRLTDTNHLLVRVRIDGKGPFNFLIDTGAPAVFVASETARKIGLKTAEGAFWTAVGRLDIEGGATLRNIKARVDDPFQLVGMNALGLPGVSIDGILGFTALARFRLEIDPTDDRMTWTRLAFEPADPPAPAPVARKPDQPPDAEKPGVNALGPLAKLAAALVGKQPEDELIPRGFLGLELSEGDGLLRVAHMLPGSPAAAAGVRDGDRLVRVGGQEVAGWNDARKAISGVKPGDPVPLIVRRAGEPTERSLTVCAGKGF